VVPSGGRVGRRSPGQETVQPLPEGAWAEGPHPGAAFWLIYTLECGTAGGCPLSSIDHTRGLSGAWGSPGIADRKALYRSSGTRYNADEEPIKKKG